jgi:hypothetical protein
VVDESGFLSLRGCDDPRVGGMVGLLIGDALGVLGVPFELKTPDRLPPRDRIEIRRPLDTGVRMRACL